MIRPVSGRFREGTILDYKHTHRQTDRQINKYSSSLGPIWQLKSGWTGKLGLGFQGGGQANWLDQTVCVCAFLCVLFLRLALLCMGGGLGGGWCFVITLSLNMEYSNLQQFLLTSQLSMKYNLLCCFDRIRISTIFLLSTTMNI